MLCESVEASSCCKTGVNSGSRQSRSHFSRLRLIHASPHTTSTLYDLSRIHSIGKREFIHWHQLIDQRLRIYRLCILHDPHDHFSRPAQARVLCQDDIEIERHSRSPAAMEYQPQCPNHPDDEHVLVHQLQVNPGDIKQSRPVLVPPYTGIQRSVHLTSQGPLLPISPPRIICQSIQRHKGLGGWSAQRKSYLIRSVYRSKQPPSPIKPMTDGQAVTEALSSGVHVAASFANKQHLLNAIRPPRDVCDICDTAHGMMRQTKDRAPKGVALVRRGAK
ncbi:hypothetical protein J3F83DRAFT_734737 [Trichoderma novae-zelandiae]